MTITQANRTPRLALALALPVLSLPVIQQAQAVSFTDTGALTTAREFHTATLLNNGKVLVAGGFGINGTLSSAELYDPATGLWTATTAMTTAREGATATLLNNGLVLVAGGYNGNNGWLSSAELYDPVNGNWIVGIGSMHTGRSRHTATLLNNGKVLVAGGWNGSIVPSTELYDPSTFTWLESEPLTTARDSHTATLLPNGNVLVAGGWNAGAFPNNYESSAELYVSATGEWTSAGSMTTRRGLHAATLLPNGKVLVVGGWDCCGNLSSVNLYNPTDGLWTATGPLNFARSSHTATLLPDGSVLVAGGSDSNGSLSSAELYFPETETWIETGSLTTARQLASATLLANGKVLVAGGLNGSPLSSVESTGCIPIGSPSITATFQNITPGSTLSGVQTVNVGATSPTLLTGATLYVDGNEVATDGGPGPYTTTFDSSDFPNGSHQLTVAVSDNGSAGSTGTTGDTPGNGFQLYGVTTIPVNFNNFLSNAKVKFDGFYPVDGETQIIDGTWSSPRHWQVDVTAEDDPSTIYRTFTGSGTSINQSWNGLDQAGNSIAPQYVDYRWADRGPAGGAPQPPTEEKKRKKILHKSGTFGIIYQSHHPPTSTKFNYSIEFYGGDPSYGPLNSIPVIVDILKDGFPKIGYKPATAVGPRGYRGNGNLTVADIGSSPILNNADIGLYVGHQVYSETVISSLGHRLPYIPHWNKSSGVMTMIPMSLQSAPYGSSTLKWMAFYSCNMLTDPNTRLNGPYTAMKNNTRLPFVVDRLRILQGYASETWITYKFAQPWLDALSKKPTEQSFHTIIGAWKYAASQSQPRGEPVGQKNIARSAYWPKCVGDVLIGILNELDQHVIHGELMEDDFTQP